jgi:hypothetical protein
MYKRNPFLTHGFASGLFQISSCMRKIVRKKYTKKPDLPSHWRLPSMVAPSQQMKGGVAGFSGNSQPTSSDRSLKYWSRVKRYYKTVFKDEQLNTL